MSGCLTIRTNDPTFRAALAHPRSTPAFKPRVLQEIAALYTTQAIELRANWDQLPESDRKWWVAWANREMPKPQPLEVAFGIVFVGFTLVNMLLHRDDALELLTAATLLRRTIVELRSKEVWDAALADSDFLKASAEGFNDLAAGRVSIVALNDL